MNGRPQGQSMRLFKSSNLQKSILKAFSILLFLSFALVGLTFNVTMNEYIRSSAVSMLNEAREGHYHLINEPPIIRLMGRTLMQQSTRSFIIDDYYNPLSDSATAHNIAFIIREGETPINRIYNQRLRTEDRTYYVTAATAVAATLVEGVADRYTIFYVDVTELLSFTRSVNLLLVSLAGLIWFLAIAITGFLASSLARPLYILRDFAQRIGQGDFTPNPISFEGEEFEDLNQSLNQTAKQLARYDNEQKTFFQNASHELRTPLMTIKSYAEGIKYGIMPPDKASLTILEATERLSGMVDDVLYISRIDSITTPTMENIDIRLLIQERINRHLALAESKGISIQYKHNNTPIIINCASSYIGRALDNLISNAMRYANSKIKIDCFFRGTQVIIRISDDGPGFEDEILPHVFERFYKGKNGLTGIGLSVVRSIVEQHQGRATAENTEKGAKLTISLPNNL